MTNVFPRPQIRIEQEITQTSSSFPPYRNGTAEHHYEVTEDSDDTSDMHVSSPSSVFHGFASHTSPPLTNAQYSQAHPKNQQHTNQRGKQKQNSYLPQSNPLPNSTNQSGAPVVYTEVHSELGIVQPKTARKISNATSLNDFNSQRPQTGRVIFDRPQSNRKTVM